VLSVFAAFTASTIASSVKAGPSVSACGSGSRAGSGGRPAPGVVSASRLTASAGSPDAWPRLHRELPQRRIGRQPAGAGDLRAFRDLGQYPANVVPGSGRTGEMGRLGSVREVRRRHCPQNHRPSQGRRSGHHHFDLRAVRQEPSQAFALLWDSHEIDVQNHKEKTIRDEDVGEIRLDFELLTAMDTPNQFLVLHRTPAGNRGHPSAG
jgi:hypothetical protein